MLQNLLQTPENFLRSAERYTMSVIFSAVYGVRLDRLDHPILVELNYLLDATMKCKHDSLVFQIFFQNAMSKYQFPAKYYRL